MEGTADWLVSSPFPTRTTLTNLVDEGGVQLPRAELDKMGAVKVVVCRCRRRLGALPRAESRTPPPEGNGAGAGNPRARTHWNYNGCGGQAAAGDTPVAEKSLKGSSVSHAVDLGEEKRIQYSTFNGEDVDTLRKPYAIFSFQYRTMGVLASLGLVSKEEGAGEDGNERKRKTYADMSKEELIEELSQRDVVGIPGVIWGALLTRACADSGSR